MSDTRMHPDENQIAALAEGRSGAEERAMLEQHLVACAACFGAYSQLVEARLRVGTAFPVPSALLDEARAIPWRLGSPRRASSASGRLWARPIAPSLLGAGVALAALLFVLGPLGSVHQISQGPGVAPRLVGPIQEVLRVASVHQLIYPAVEAPAEHVTPVLRADLAGDDPELQRISNELSRMYVQSDDDAAVAYWLGAVDLARGLDTTAESVVKQARRRWPADKRLRTLDAQLAFIRDDLERAEELLRADGGIPRDAIGQVNLAIVRARRGAADEATEMFRRVLREHPGSFAAQRATAELRTLGEPVPATGG